MKLSDLKDLKVIRKNLAPEPEKPAAIPAIRKEQDEVFALSCTYTFGPMGVTNVTVR